MTEDELHDQLHDQTEDRLRALLLEVFPHRDANMCRTAVLLNPLHDEFMAMDEVEDVSETMADIGQLVLKRMLMDHNICNTQGRA